MRDSSSNKLELALSRLHGAVVDARHKDPDVSRTAALLKKGRKKAAKKVAEEAAEVAIDGYAGDHPAIVAESADLLYNLTVLWVLNDVSPADIAGEMERREAALGIAEKWPKRKSGKKRQQ